MWDILVLLCPWKDGYNWNVLLHITTGQTDWSLVLDSRKWKPYPYALPIINCIQVIGHIGHIVRFTGLTERYRIYNQNFQDLLMEYITVILSSNVHNNHMQRRQDWYIGTDRQRKNWKWINLPEVWNVYFLKWLWTAWLLLLEYIQIWCLLCLKHNKIIYTI